ncbi:MAG TPA: hypothetical protein VJ875_22515 [Pyrinomonadaceae bacterium]|nr:hypothetical protein [Pyrinomonadaceae bacterium]
MKTRLTYSLLLTLLLTMVVMGQQSRSTEPTDLTVLDHSWGKEYTHQRVDSNPLQPNEDLMRQTRAEKQVIRQREYDLPQTVQRPMPLPTTRPIPGRGHDVYVYKIKVKNNGAKLIKEVDWEFRFLHPDTQELLGSRQIVSKLSLSPGKTKVIKSQTVQQPTHVVSADQLDKKYRNQFKEEVVIHRIVYSDGSTWRRQP